MAYHTQSLIIHHDHFHRNVLTLHPLQLLDIHLECTVTADTGYRLPGGIMGSDRRRKCIAHGTMSTGKKNLLILFIVERLIAPYHMLTYINSHSTGISKLVT